MSILCSVKEPDLSWTSLWSLFQHASVNLGLKRNSAQQNPWGKPPCRVHKRTCCPVVLQGHHSLRNCVRGTWKDVKPPQPSQGPWCDSSSYRLSLGSRLYAEGFCALMLSFLSSRKREVLTLLYLWAKNWRSRCNKRLAHYRTIVQNLVSWQSDQICSHPHLMDTFHSHTCLPSEAGTENCLRKKVTDGS